MTDIVPYWKHLQEDLKPAERRDAQENALHRFLKRPGLFNWAAITAFVIFCIVRMLPGPANRTATDGPAREYNVRSRVQSFPAYSLPPASGAQARPEELSAAAKQDRLPESEKNDEMPDSKELRGYSDGNHIRAGLPPGGNNRLYPGRSWEAGRQFERYNTVRGMEHRMNAMREMRMRQQMRLRRFGR